MALNFQQRGSAFLRRVLFIAFLVASLALVTMYSREAQDGPLHTVQSAVSGSVAPLKFVGAAANSGVNSAGQSIENLTADEGTLSGLRESNAELRELLAQADEYKQEAQRLQNLLDLKDSYDIDGVGARIIGNSDQAWDQTVTIDKGSADGVETGLTVMGASGVVGQVYDVAEHTARIRLLTDSNSGAAALVQSSRAEGIVRGSLEGLLYFENVDADAVVNPGDVVVTSGLGGSYTRGLIIGTVVKVDTRQGDASRRIVVSPNDNTSVLEEVLVVFGVGADTEDSGEGGNAAGNGTDEGGDVA